MENIEIDFLKKIIHWQKKATEEAFKLHPVIEDDKVAYPESNGRYEKCIYNVKILEECLVLLKEKN